MSKKGILTHLAKAPPAHRKRRRASRVRRTLAWLGGGVLVVAVVALMVFFAVLSFDPSLGARQGEADVAVERIDQDPTGFPRDVAAAAIVTLEGREARIPLTGDRRREVDVGVVLRVRYTHYPRTGAVQVEGWEVRP